MSLQLFFSFVYYSYSPYRLGATGTSQGKTHIFKTRVRKVKTSEGK